MSEHVPYTESKLKSLVAKGKGANQATLERLAWMILEGKKCAPEPKEKKAAGSKPASPPSGGGLGSKE